MTTLTPNMGLVIYGATDSSALFYNYRNDINGPSTTSGFNKIDTYYGYISASIVALQGRYQPFSVPAVYISPSYYEATGITNITSYATNMQVDIQLDTTNDGTVTLNINSLGTKTLQKIDAITGSAINFVAGDMKKGRDYLFRYNGSAFILTSAATGDMISISGTNGNILVTSASGTISDSGSSINSLAPINASYLTTSLNSTLTGETVLTAGSGIGISTNTSASTTTISASLIAGSGIEITTGCKISVKVTGNNNEIPILSGSALISSGSTIAQVVASVPGGTPSSDGWNNISFSGSCISFDASGSTVTFKYFGDTSGSIQVGDKFYFINSGSSIYGFYTSASAYTSGSTQYTGYTGTNYSISGSTLTSPKFSHAKSPFGFSTDPTKWTVEVSDNVDRSQSNPTQNTYYNLGSVSITIPLGLWRVEYFVGLEALKSSATNIEADCSLSTSASANTDVDFYCQIYLGGASGTIDTVQQVYRAKTLSLPLKTTYYLISKTTQTGAIALKNNNASGCKLFIRATCSYL